MIDHHLVCNTALPNRAFPTQFDQLKLLGSYKAIGNGAAGMAKAAPLCSLPSIKSLAIRKRSNVVDMQEHQMIQSLL